MINCIFIKVCHAHAISCNSYLYFSYFREIAILSTAITISTSQMLGYSTHVALTTAKWNNDVSTMLKELLTSAELTKVWLYWSKSRVGWRTKMRRHCVRWNGRPTHRVVLLQTVHNECLPAERRKDVHKQDITVCSQGFCWASSSSSSMGSMPIDTECMFNYLTPFYLAVVVVGIRSHNWSARQRHHRLQSVV